MSRKIILIKQELLLLVYELNRSGLLAENEKIRPILAQLEKLLLCDLSPSTNDSVKTDALDEEKWLNMLGTFVKDWFRYESHFVHGRDSLVDILKERGLLCESDAVQPLIVKKSLFKLLNKPDVSRRLRPLLSSLRLLPICIYPKIRSIF